MMNTSVNLQKLVDEIPPEQLHRPVPRSAVERIKSEEMTSEDLRRAIRKYEPGSYPSKLSRNHKVRGRKGKSGLIGNTALGDGPKRPSFLSYPGQLKVQSKPTDVC